MPARYLLAGLGLLLGVGVVGADDEMMKKGESVRYPNYTYEEDVPHEKQIVPGSSAGIFYERNAFGDMFIGRWNQRYLNYGWKNYENYRLNTTPFLRRYDTFGNFIADGYEIFGLEEFRARRNGVGSLERKGQFYQNWLRHLIIADDSYGGWNTRLIVGDFIRTTFTPLTLDMNAFNGIRFDAISTNNHALTLVFSRISDPIKLLATGNLRRVGQTRNTSDGVYLMGAHWESSVGGALTLGASYVNLHRFDSRRGFLSNSRKGLAPRNSLPQKVIVRFEDDSPEDGFGGAAVFDIFATVTLAAPVGAKVEEERKMEIRPGPVQTSPGVVQRGQHLEVSGFFREEGFRQPNFADYVFEVPGGAKRMEITALVANDYKISMRQDHFFVTDRVRGSGEKRSTNFAIVRRAEGNVVDMSNQRVISFDYGLSTGVEVMGINGKLRMSGLEILGEIARSNNYFQYPTLVGKRSDFDDTAGYLVVKKKWSHLTLGGEYFSIGPKYTSYNPHPTDVALDQERAPLGEEFYFNEARQNFYRNGLRSNITNTPFFALVDDNDNLLYNELPDNWTEGGQPIEVNNGRSGIFPFYDLNQDGNADTNRDRDEFPDYDEPFLMYNVDPEEFYFGDDFNNNSVTDAWEDDNLPNYPYYKDEQGLHLRGSLRPLRGVELTLGRYDVNQIAAAGKNDVFYGRVDLDRRFRNWHLSWNHESKDTEDSIPNDFFRYFLRDAIGGYTRTSFKDRLEARDSLINRGLLKVDYTPLNAWNLEGKFRYELNHQRDRSFGDGTSQDEDDINFFGTVFRTDYTYVIGAFDLMPRFKFLYRFQERKSEDDPRVKNFQVIPIFRADYHLTPRTQLRLGIQGFPGLVDRRRDFADERNDSDRKTITFMWFSQSEYEGFRIGTEIGFTRQDINFDEPEVPDLTFNRFFVRFISALGGVVR